MWQKKPFSKCHFIVEKKEEEGNRAFGAEPIRHVANAGVQHKVHLSGNMSTMVFCFQNCSNLL